ncbi:SRPBCC family protein [Nocardia higoensis]|uniref:SRPBCC family protein n=1 Tax=Nocardia higoensis TaxID=228599 RepID=UPI0003046F5A|nr:SRPBCC family protein [Nocardia higoensis]
MHTIDEVKHQVNDLVGKVVGAGGERTSVQSVTIAAPREQVEECWRDPVRLSRLLGDTGEVRSNADRVDWTFGHDDAQTTWRTTRTTEPDGLRYSGDLAGSDAELRVEFTQAPKDLGTEVTVRVRSALPGLMTGAMAFKLLYRMRALLQTGELPTLEHNPSARPGAR